jgi:hypothetical protein
MKKAILGTTVIAVALCYANFAEAQCGTGYGVTVCGQVYVNPPPVVLVPPPPPVVYVPPPAVYVPPPVIYTPPPPPVIVTAPPPPVVAAPAAPPERPFVRHRGLGLGVRASGGYDGSTQVGMYGGGALLRYIASPRFGLELTADGYGGEGYGGAERTEFPITINALWFLNPRSRAQLYLLGGLGVSIAQVEQHGETDDPVYGGGQLGIGVEFLLGNHIGLTLDARGFLRGRMNERDEGLMAHDGSCREVDGVMECTDVEGGATFNVGFNFYL